MNNKISSGQAMIFCIGLMISLFPSLANFTILPYSKNSSIISFIIAFIIGFIPILMTIYIGKKIKNKSLQSYLKNNLKTGKILTVVLILIAIFTLFINTWLFIDFTISQFLTRSSYYILGLAFALTTSYAVSKGIETISRGTFILFIIEIIILLLIWIFLIPNIELSNLKPYIDVKKDKIIKSIVVFLCILTTQPIYILHLKKYTKDIQNFERKIIVSYIVASIIIFTFIFLIISIYGINMATIQTYPVYALFKKIQVFGFIERIENIAAIVLGIIFITQYIYITYFITDNIKEMLNIKSKKKVNILIYLLPITISLTSIYLFQNHNLINIILISPYIIGITFIVIFIIFIKTLFQKKQQT